MFFVAAHALAKSAIPRHVSLTILCVRFSELTVAHLLESLASSNPTPGGGTASAIAGAMGVSLLIMVGSLAKSRNNTDAEKSALNEVRASLLPIVKRLSVLADEDSDAFDQVMAAYRLAKSTDAEKAARAAAIQKALQDATTVPLQTLRACAEALGRAVAVADAGNRSATSDVGVAIGLLEAAARGAESNVRINLDGIKDESFAASVRAESDTLSVTVDALAAEARGRLA